MSTDTYGYYSSEICYAIMKKLRSHYDISLEQYSANITLYEMNELFHSCDVEQDVEKNNRYSEPMVWIGIYITVASSICILAMVSDLLHGFQNKKFWFPCKYFTLNAASITVITVAMKLPVDLSSEMPTFMEQATKLGSLALMCTMMANLMPSLASMDNKTLVANIIGLSILVITMIVNVSIQINTGVIKYTSETFISLFRTIDCVIVAYIYMVMMIMLLIIMISSSLTIPTAKEILEFKYQATNKASLVDQSLQHSQMSTVEKLRQHVRRHWVMAETSSPQFVMASNPLSTASGVICVIILAMNLLVGIEVALGGQALYQSVYKWSILNIFIIQTIGVLVGTIAPMFRCFAVLSFKLVTKWDRNHLKVFRVEKYWTQRMYEWKQYQIPFLSSSRRSRALIHETKNVILRLCIIFQKAIVVSCKLIWLIPVIIIIFVAYCWKSLQARLSPKPIASRTDDIILELSSYALQIQDEMELADKTLKRISNSMNSLISKAEKDQNNNLLKLLEKATGFNGVEIFDSDHVQSLLPVELVNSWSLPIVTLTCIAVALPNIRRDLVESLVKSVGEGLSYTHLVEECLNRDNEYVNIRNATTILWHDVENNCK